MADLDALARELKERLEKATELQPGPAFLDNPIDPCRVVTQPRRAVTLGLAECICETEARCYVNLRNAAPLLLKEREALRAIESELRRTHVRCAENAKSCYWCELLVALDAAREEGAR